MALRTYTSVKDAEAFARFAYSGLTDMAGADYIEHPLRVLRYVRERGAPPYVQSAALFHDVIEDTCITAQLLLDLGFHRDTVELVVLLTRTLDVESDEYYRRIREVPQALLIKDGDIADNTQEWRLAYLSPARQAKLRAKYAHALEVLHPLDELIERATAHNVRVERRT